MRQARRTVDGQRSNVASKYKPAAPKMSRLQGEINQWPKRRARPKPTLETRHFRDGTQAGELRLLRCDAGASVNFPPRGMLTASGAIIFTNEN